MSRDGRAGRKARELTNGTQTDGAFRGRQSRVVLAPVAGVKFAEVSRARPGFVQAFNPRMTVTRRIRRRGEHEISR